MSSILWKNAFLCFPNFKCTTLLSTSTSTSKEDSSSISLSSTTSTLIKNFSSIYDHSTTTSSESLASSTDYFFSSDYDSDTGDISPPPDFTTIFASERFFCSSPGHSNSIIQSLDFSPSESTTTISGNAIPIQTDSPEPYLDFLRSMEEMVGARNLNDAADDWDFLHELLLCYLRLNPKDSHKFILGAFSDLLITLLSSPSRRKIDHRQHHATPQSPYPSS